MANYAAYVQDQSDQLLAKTEQFVELYKAGDDDAARALYPDARTHWERIETVAESFGDLDPKMDAREADLEPGQKWTGWHRIEKDLWPQRAEDYTPLTAAERATYADDLLANTQTLDKRVAELTYTVDQIANGSRGLLEEVATGKVTGEEEYWSRTDLWDFQANVDGARVGYEGVKPILEEKDPELADDARRRASPALQALLDAQQVGDGFKTYDQLTPDEVKQLSDAVNALSEPLSKLTAAVAVVSLRTCAGAGLADAPCSAAARPPPGWRARSSSAGRARARAAASRRPAPASYAFRGDAPGRHRHPGPGPAALRGVRRHHRRPRRSSSTLLQAVDRGGRADDPGQAGRHRRAGRGRLQPAARRHRRGDRAPAERADDHLRLRADAVPHRGRQGPVRPRRPAAGGAAHAAALPRRRPRPRALVRRPVRPGLRRRPAGRRARDPQPGPDRLRHRRGPLVAARLRPHLDDLDQPVHAAEPVRLQGRHR